VNILDENIIDSQCQRLQHWRIAMRHMGYDVGRHVPFPCLCSKRGRYFCPTGLFRSKRTAASANAHVREALPIFAPEVAYGLSQDQQALVGEYVLRGRITHGSFRGQ
jgi:hypothetical protein